MKENTINPYMIKLKWVENRTEAGRSEIIHFTKMDESIFKASPERYKKIVRDTEKGLLYNERVYGTSWTMFYNPYQAILLYYNGELIESWTLSKYLRERRK